MERIFQTAFDNNVMNLNILAQDKNTSVWSMSIYKTYENDCHSITKYTVATFTRENYTSEMSMTFNQLFPSKLSNLNGCTIKVATFPYEPFVIVRTKGYNDSIFEFDGIDVTIVENIAKRLNFKPQYLLPADGKNRGIIFDNGTANGCMQMVIEFENMLDCNWFWKYFISLESICAQVLEGQVDLSIAVYTLALDRSHWMSPTIPYMYAPIVFAYKGTEFSLTLTVLLEPFRYHVWFSIFLLFFSSILIIFLTKTCNRRHRHFIIGGRLNRTPVLNLMNAALGNAVPKVNDIRYFGTFARSLLMFWILTWLILRNSYGGALYKYLNNQKFESIYDTFEKIQNSDCQIIIANSSIARIGQFIDDKTRLVQRLQRIYIYIHIYVGFEVSILKCLNFRFYQFKGTAQKVFPKLSNGDLNGVVYIHAHSVEYFNLIYPFQRLEYTESRAFINFPVFYFAKHSKFVDAFNQQLNLFIESGLIEYWTERFIDRKKYEKRDKIPQKLGVNGILAIFTICTALYTISLLVFIAEILSDKFAFLKRSIENLTYWYRNVSASLKVYGNRTIYFKVLN